MKSIALLFALYTMALSVSPCADGLQINGAYFNAWSHDSQHQDKPDDCSPFCQCACCHVFVVITVFHPLLPVPSFSQNQFPAFTAHIPSHYAADFWQPPRLG